MMAETKHTPGPWKAVSSVSFESGLTYVSVHPEHSDAERDKPLAMANGEFHVCRMSHTAARHHIALYEANARLIAAAPDLHEAGRKLAAEVGALRAFEHEIRAAIGNTNWSVLIDRLVGMDTATAKAEGRA